MASYESSRSLSVSPTAFSVLSAATTTATVVPPVPHGFVRFKNNIKGVEQLSLQELKSRLASTEETLANAHFSPHVMQKMFEKAESLRLRISELEGSMLTESYGAMQISSPSSSPPAFDPSARVIMRTKALAVARPIISRRGGTQGITFAESRPLETMAWEVQKEEERRLEEEREQRRMKMEEEGISEETLRYREMEAKGIIGRPAVREQRRQDKMWAFMNYKGPQDELDDDDDEQMFQFDDDDDDWPDNTATGTMESVRSTAILPGSEDYYPPDPSGYQYGNDSGKWLST